jgi:S1-C subfamily serine protease
VNNQVTGPAPPPRPPLAPPTTPSGTALPTSPPSFSRDLGPRGAGLAPLPPLPAAPEGGSGGSHEPRPRRWIAAGAASAVVVAVLVGVLFGFGGSSGHRAGSSATTTTIPQPLDVPALSRRVGPAVAAIVTGSGATAGSGIVVSASGLVATTAAAVGDAATVEIALGDGKSRPADLVGSDPDAGVAVLQIRGASGLPTAVLSETAAAVGDEVVAVGAPTGPGAAPSAAEGVVSADGASAKIGTARVDGLIQTDAAVTAAATGGPLVDRRGQVVGMSIAVDGGAEGSGYALSVATLRTEIQQIQAGQGTSGPHSPSLGAQTRDVSTLTPAEVARYGVQTSDGAMVVEVDNRSSAHTAGLAVGDVITAIDAQVVNNGADLTGAIGSLHAGDQVVITYERGGDIHNVKVVLRSRADTGN